MMGKCVFVVNFQITNETFTHIGPTRINVQCIELYKDFWTKITFIKSNHKTRQSLNVPLLLKPANMTNSKQYFIVLVEVKLN